MLPPMTMARWRAIDEPPGKRDGEILPQTPSYTELVRRLGIIVLALVIGAAAPARALCEAACLATHLASATPHCPLHDSSSDGPSIAAADISGCPAIEAARPTTTARIDLKAAPIAIDPPRLTPKRLGARLVTVVLHSTTVFERHTPLRI